MSAPLRRAALYLDFDNVFAGLALRDEAAAWHFAAEPGRWLAWLAEGGDGGGARRVLVRRCYLNPAGWTEPVPGGALAQWLGQPRIFYSRFRADFVRAGFTVIDCPRLARLKNGADILMALDVVEALGHPTRFEEVILLSGDSDFTPLLHRLREHDRRTLLVAQDASAQALRAAADSVIALEDFAAVAVLPQPEAEAPALAEPLPAATREALQEAIRQILRTQHGRLRLSALGQTLRLRFGDAVAEGAYGGTGSLQKLLAAMPDLSLRPADGADWANLVEAPDPQAADPYAAARAIVAEAGGSLATAALGNLFQQRLGYGLRNSAYAGAGSLDDFVTRAGLRFGAEGQDRNVVMLAPDISQDTTPAEATTEAGPAPPTVPKVTPAGAAGPGDPIDDSTSGSRGRLTGNPDEEPNATIGASPAERATRADDTGPAEDASDDGREPVRERPAEGSAQVRNASEAPIDVDGDDSALAEGADTADAQHGPLADLLLRALGPGLDLSGLTARTLAAILAGLGRHLPLAGPPPPALADAVAEEAGAVAGAPPPPHAVPRLIRLLQLGRFDWSADPGPEPAARLAMALEAEAHRQAAISRVRLTPAEQVALAAWIHGGMPAPATPPAGP